MTAAARVFSTYPWRDASWRARADVVDLPPAARARVRAVLAASASHDVLVLNGFSKADIVGAAVVARRRRRPRVVVLDPTWERGDSAADRLFTRGAVRLVDGDHVHYGVLSDVEVDTFPRTWGVGPDRVHRVLWCCTLPDEVLAAPRGSGGGVFAGGNSLRDWDLLVDAVQAVPVPTTIASASLTPEQSARTPAHVRAAPVSASRYDELLLAADVVVVPMQARPDRSSGQGTILAAMALGKPVVVNDAPGVRDYVDDGRTGVVVPLGDAGALAEALRRLAADAALRAGLGAAAQEEVARRFLPRHYAQRVLALVDRITGAGDGLA